MLAAVGALAALLTDCSISVEREEVVTPKAEGAAAPTVIMVEQTTTTESGGRRYGLERPRPSRFGLGVWLADASPSFNSFSFGLRGGVRSHRSS